MQAILRALIWLVVAGVGAAGYYGLAFSQGQSTSSIYLLIAALCTYAIGYRFYSKWLAAQALCLEERRATPCEVHEDGRDFVRTNRWIVFGHHFAAISGPGPLVGPVLAAQFGFLPGILWILIGVVLGGAVQDFIVLFCSIRRNGRSLGQMVKDELNSFAGGLALVAILAIMVILLAVLGLIVVKTLAESPWGVFTVGATIPIAFFMGGYLRFLRPGQTLEATAIGVVLLFLAVWGGQYVHSHPTLSKAFTFEALPIAKAIIGYGLLASILPVWLLLAPRDYLSTFMKLGTILALALGVLLVLPELKMPPVTKFIDGSGLVVAGKLFPFCFITIACGAISGFHSLISSGITPKIITRESYARPIGYGAMCLESLVAVMALIAACTLEPGVYLAMNVKGAGTTPAAIAADTVRKVEATGFTISTTTMDQLAQEVGEKSLYGRTGGAATLAVGMAQIFSKLTQGRLLDIWYHFAIMFEALFILTTLDAGTRVGRYLLQDVLGHLWKPLGDTGSLPANILSSALVVGGWGYFLIQGVLDPLGGINSLWPLFGIANQLLAAIALCLATTVLLKSALKRRANPASEGAAAKGIRSPALMLVTLVPLAWLLSVTFTAGWQKITHPEPRMGFLAAARDYDAKLPALETALANAATQGEAAIATAKKAIATNRALRFNNQLDAVVTAIFLTFAALIILSAAWVWASLLAKRQPPTLTETDPVWLPGTGASPESGLRAMGVATLAFGLLRHWSGQSDVDRVHTQMLASLPDSPTVPGTHRLLIDLPEVRAEIADQRRKNAPAEAYVQVCSRRFDRGASPCC
jgi:carbon starvation protein